MGLNFKVKIYSRSGLGAKPRFKMNMYHALEVHTNLRKWLSACGIIVDFMLYLIDKSGWLAADDYTITVATAQKSV